MFGAKATNAKFSLWLLKPRSNHINELKSFIKQLAEIDAKVDEEDIKAILLNCLPSTYDNVSFPLGQLSSQPLDDMISSPLSEDKRLNERLNEGDLETLHLEKALLAKN